MTASERETELSADDEREAGVSRPAPNGNVRVVSSAATTEPPSERADGVIADSALSDLVDEAPDGRVVIDGHGRILRVNAALEVLFGYHRSELLGQSIEVLVPDEARAAHVESRGAFGIDPKVRSMGLGLQLIGRHRNGSEVAVDIRLSPLPTKAGTWVVADVRDETRRRDAEKHRQIAIVSDEDLRIARKFGETVIHGIFGVGLKMQTLLPRAGEQVRAELAEVLDSLDEIISDIRGVIFGLSTTPPDTDQTGD
jgi:PAS domain S-box-containing protein